MARIRKKGMLGIIIGIVIVVVVGSYFAKGSMNRGSADAAADSTADSTLAEGKNGDDKNGKDKDKKKEPDPVPVEISTVLPRQITSYYYTTANLEPEKKVEIHAKIAGEIEDLLVEEGDVVKEGALLCQIEDDELRVALDEAELERGMQQREYDRLKEMHDQKLISNTEFMERKYQFQVAQNKYAAAQIKYEHTRVKAPFGGVITKRLVDDGQTIAVGTPLFEIVDPEPLLIRMYLPENEVRDIHLGQAVSIHPDNNPDATLTGRIVRIAPEVDDRTGTVKVTAETNGSAMPGSFARIKIVTDTHEGSLTIPRRGLVSDAGDLYVYIAEADTVRRASIRIGYQDEDFAEVVEGLVYGDSVVVVGIGGLRTGTKIKVLDPTMQDELSRQGEKPDGEAASN